MERDKKEIPQKRSISRPRKGAKKIWIAIDGSVSKAPLGGKEVGPSPVDRRKIGTKKHICVDQNGIVLGITVSGANRHDNIFVERTINSIPIKLLHQHIVFAADTAYDAKNTRRFLKKRNFVPLISQNKRRSIKVVEKNKLTTSLDY